LLDSGALYRLVALGGMKAGLAPHDLAGHARIAATLDTTFSVDVDGSERVILAGQDLTRE
ncbi:MAG: cytidylate kinase, partial [Steroidobacteraceae bacterium]